MDRITSGIAVTLVGVLGLFGMFTATNVYYEKGLKAGREEGIVKMSKMVETSECTLQLQQLKDSSMQNLNELNSQINECYEEADKIRSNLTQLCVGA